MDDVGQAPAASRRNILGIALQVLLGLIALLLIAWLILFITKGRFLKPSFERIASGVLERKVEVAGDFQLYLDPLDIHFVAQDLAIANPKWAGDRYFFRARHIDSRIASLPLILGKRRINWLDLTGGRIDLQWDETGRRNTWTFGDPSQPPKPLDLPTIRRAALTGTMLHYRDPRMQLVADIDFETIRAARKRIANDIRFSGTGHLHNRPFTLTGNLLSPNETVAGRSNRFTLDARGAGNRLTVAGTLPGATEIDGADLAVTAHGANLARLFDFIGVAVPDTRRYTLASQLTKSGDVWRFSRLRGRFGNTDLSGRLTISRPADRLRLDAELASRSADIVDLGPFIGYQPGAGAIRMVGGAPRVLPDAPLRIDALSGFDAHLVYTVRDIRGQSLPVSHVALTLDLDRRLLRLSPFSFDMARGHLASDIVIDARRTPVITDYDIRLSLGQSDFKWIGESDGSEIAVNKAN